jgi:hypothetical protein
MAEEDNCASSARSQSEASQLDSFRLACSFSPTSHCRSPHFSARRLMLVLWLKRRLGWCSNPKCKRKETTVAADTKGRGENSATEPNPRDPSLWDARALTQSGGEKRRQEAASHLSMQNAKACASSFAYIVHSRR